MKSFLDFNDGYNRFSGKAADRIYTAKYSPFFEPGPQSLNEMSENLKLKKVLKQAVESVTAPRWLVDSIKSGIRR